MTKAVFRCFPVLAIVGGVAAALVVGCSSSNNMSGTGGAAGGGTGGTPDCPITACLGATSLDCTNPITPNAMVSDFTTGCTYHRTEGKWGQCPLIGSTYPYSTDGTASARVDFAAAQQNFHFSATVLSGNYAGAGMQFEACSDVSTFTGIQFTLQGTTDSCDLELQLATYDQRPSSQGSFPGSCDSSDGGSCYGYPTAKTLPSPADLTTPLTVNVKFADVPNWTATTAKELVGLQWQATNPKNNDPDGGGILCNLDLRIDNIVFTTN